MKKRSNLAIGPRLLPLAGARIGIVCGPGEFPQDQAGTIICQVTDRWGTHALAMMDTGAVRTVEGLTTVGIGVYLLSGHAAPIGYTEAYVADCTQHCINIMVMPGTDLDGTFQAWDLEAGAYIQINGWLWVFERVSAATERNQDCG